MVTIIFQNSYVTPLIRLSFRLISDLKVTCNYLLDLNKFCIVTNWRMENTVVTIIFQNSYATPLIRLNNLDCIINSLEFLFFYVYVGIDLKPVRHRTVVYET